MRTRLGNSCREQDNHPVAPERGFSTASLRYKLFAKAGYITTESRKPILNLALAMQQRTWMQGLWDGANSFELPAKFTPIYSP
jgi:hypothetical protein